MRSHPGFARLNASVNSLSVPTLIRAGHRSVAGCTTVRGMMAMRSLELAIVVAIAGCGASRPVQGVGRLVTEARSDQLAFAAKNKDKGIALRGNVQKKGIKQATESGFDFSGQGVGSSGASMVVGSAHGRSVNVNYGYVFLAEGDDSDKRALCLFEPENLRVAAELRVGQPVTLTCLFSKFVGSEAAPVPVFWGCSVTE